MTNIKFEMNEAETDAALAWMKEHIAIHTNTSFTYSFTYTGIGIYTVVKCRCGAEKNVSDYGSW